MVWELAQLVAALLSSLFVSFVLQPHVDNTDQWLGLSAQDAISYGDLSLESLTIRRGQAWRRAYPKRYMGHDDGVVLLSAVHHLCYVPGPSGPYHLKSFGVRRELLCVNESYAARRLESVNPAWWRHSGKRVRGSPSRRLNWMTPVLSDFCMTKVQPELSCIVSHDQMQSRETKTPVPAGVLASGPVHTRYILHVMRSSL